MEEALIAPCGMNCAVCVSYLAFTHDINKSGFNRKYCPGCVPRGRNCLHMRDSCDLLGEGQIRFCFECPEFPCRRLKSLDERYRTKYHLSMIENLVFIRDQGLPALLAREETKWRCPECGDVVSCHNGLCLNCGLDKLRQNRKYRWGER